MVIDIAVIMLLCIFSVFGYKKGMLLSIFSIFSFILSLYITYLVLPYASSWLKSIIPLQKITTNWLDAENFNVFIQKNSKMSLLIKFLLRSNSDLSLDNIISVIANAILFVVISIIIRIILKSVLTKVANIIKQFFILGSFDRMCGLLFGFVKGIIISCIVCFIVISFADLNLFNQDILDQISNSTLVSVFADNTNQIIKTFTNYFMCAVLNFII